MHQLLELVICFHACLFVYLPVSLKFTHLYIQIKLSYPHRLCQHHPSIHLPFHYDDVTMMAIASPITSLTIVYSAVYSGAHQTKHQSSASLAFVWGIHRGPVNSPHKWPVTREIFPFDDVIMRTAICPSKHTHHRQTSTRTRAYVHTHIQTQTQQHNKRLTHEPLLLIRINFNRIMDK